MTTMARYTNQKRKFMETHRCRHRVLYSSHPNCYLTENPENIVVGHLDIETSNLKANFGIVFCYCIKIHNEDKILYRVVTREELKKNLDKEVIKQCIKDLQQFDIITGYYSTKFDVPFLRTRAKHWGLNFPTFGQLKHKDLYYVVRNKFCLNSNRLETACRAIIGKTEKNHIDANYWIRALQGDKKSLEYILDHCKRDVRDLERVYNEVMPYVKETFNSI